MFVLIVQLTMYNTCQLRAEGTRMYASMHQLYFILFVVFDIDFAVKGDEYPMK